MTQDYKGATLRPCLHFSTWFVNSDFTETSFDTTVHAVPVISNSSMACNFTLCHQDMGLLANKSVNEVIFGAV